jgi:alpha-tubulin suppressor-like RCC1 family protein
LIFGAAFVGLLPFGPLNAQAPTLSVTPADSTISVGQTQQFTADGAITPAAVVGGAFHTCMLMSDGSVRCVGRNNAGQLGNNDATFTDVSEPVTPVGLTSVVGLGAGSEFNCALVDDGTMRCWGSNYTGQLGNGTLGGYSLFPQPVQGITTAIKPVVGSFFTCTILSDFTVRCWGRNADGQLGNGNTVDTGSPQSVIGLGSVADLTAGGYHTCALMTNGTIRCWGRNDTGQLGNGTVTSSSTPVQVSGITNAIAVSAGGYFTCALLADGTVHCWGWNDYGQIGSPPGFSSVPVNMSGLTNVVSVFAGGYHACAVRSDGTMWCWGNNEFGELGNGTTTGSSTPVQVSGINGPTAVTLGAWHTCVLLADVSARCWGQNIYGQFGNGTTTSSATAMRMHGTGLTWISTNTGVATIDAAGQATGLSPGVTTITLTDGSGTGASTTLTVQGGQVATPTFSPAGGTYAGSVMVTISDATSGATIYNTTDGTTPTTASPVYTGRITLTQTRTLKAMAAKSGMTNSAVASATYTIQQPYFTLTTSKTGLGSGTVTSSPAGIDCGFTCSASYASGTTVILTTTVSAGSTFAGWSGAGCSGTGACTLTLTADTSVTASFALAGISAPVLMWRYGGCLSGPYCERAWYSSPAVADLDGDGQPDVIWGAGDVVALNGANGSLKWRAGSDKRVWSGVAVADLTGNGTPEVIAARKYDELTVYDRFGNTIWTRNPFGSGELRTMAVADLENDGRLEIIVGTASVSTYQLNAFEPDGAVRSGWPVRHDGDPGDGSGLWNQNVTVADMNGDGFKEVITTTGSHYMTAIDRSGNQLPANGVYAPQQYWSQVGLAVDYSAELRGYVNCGAENRPYLGDSAPDVADVNGDGVPELVVVGNVYDCSTGPYTDLYHMPFILNLDRTRWSGSGFDWIAIPTPGPGSAPRSEDFDVIENAMPNPSVADLDGDGLKEILFASYDGKVHAYWLDKTEHGNWPYTIPTSGASGDDFRFASEPVVVDLNNDGHAEVIFTTWPKKASGRVGQLIVLDYLGHELSRTNLPAPAIGETWNGALDAPTIANIDSDPDLEVVVGTVSSGVVAYKLPNTANARILWGTGRGNYLRTGVPGVP